jgi:hypothetical protein
VEPARSTRTAPPEVPASERKAWLAAARAQRKPTRPGQVVVTRSSANWTQYVRVDLGDDPRLPVLDDEIRRAETLFLGRVTAALATGR